MASRTFVVLRLCSLALFVASGCVFFALGMWLFVASHFGSSLDMPECICSLDSLRLFAFGTSRCVRLILVIFVAFPSLQSLGPASFLCSSGAVVGCSSWALSSGPAEELSSTDVLGIGKILELCSCPVTRSRATLFSWRNLRMMAANENVMTHTGIKYSQKNNKTRINPYLP